MYHEMLDRGYRERINPVLEKAKQGIFLDKKDIDLVSKVEKEMQRSDFDLEISSKSIFEAMRYIAKATKSYPKTIKCMKEILDLNDTLRFEEYMGELHKTHHKS